MRITEMFSPPPVESDAYYLYYAAKAGQIRIEVLDHLVKTGVVQQSVVTELILEFGRQQAERDIKQRETSS